MQRSRGKFLAGPVLAGNQDGSIGSAHLLDIAQDLPDRRRCTHDAVVNLDLAGQPFHAVGQPPDHERVAQRHEQPVGVEGLLEEVEGPLARRLDGGADGAVARYHDHHGAGVPLPNPFQDLQPVHLGHLHVQENDIRPKIRVVDQAARPVGRQMHSVPLVLEQLLQRDADRLLVVDDENPCHGSDSRLSAGPSGADRHEPPIMVRSP